MIHGVYHWERNTFSRHFSFISYTHALAFVATSQRQHEIKFREPSQDVNGGCPHTFMYAEQACTTWDIWKFASRLSPPRNTGPRTSMLTIPKLGSPFQLERFTQSRPGPWTLDTLVSRPAIKQPWQCHSQSDTARHIRTPTPLTGKLPARRLCAQDIVYTAAVWRRNACLLLGM